MSKIIKSIVFDMDGVLVDAAEWHFLAFNKALGDYGYNIAVNEHITIFNGLPTRKKLCILSEKYNLPIELHTEINYLKQQYTVKYIEEMCRPIEKHQIALKALQSQGYLIGLASNSIRATVDMVLDKAEISHFFDVIISSSDVTNPKPHPEIYQKAMSFLRVPPQATLVVEDNKHGIEAAKAAGAHLLEVQTVNDVHLENIQFRIKALELEIERAHL